MGKRDICMVVAAAALMLAGCASSHQARSIDLNEVKGALLVNPDVLERGSGDQMLYRYVNPAVRITDYTKIMIDPVIISKQAELDAKERENYQKLANNAYLIFTREMELDFPIVKEPGKGVLRVQFAIEDADSSKPVRNILSSATPIGLGLSLVKYTATGKSTGVGEITGEFRVTDSLTGQLVGAALDRRVGNKNAQGVVDIWANADDALEYWAKRFRFVICKGYGRDNCVKP